MFDKILIQHSAVLAAITENNGEGEAQKNFNTCIQEAMSELEAERNASAEKFASMESDAAKLNEAVADANKALEAAESKVTSAEAVVAEKEAEIKSLQGKLATVQADLEKAEEANKKLSAATDKKLVEVEANVSDDDVLEKPASGDDLWEKHLKKAANRQKAKQN